MHYFVCNLLLLCTCDKYDDDDDDDDVCVCFNLPCIYLGQKYKNSASAEVADRNVTWYFL